MMDRHKEALAGQEYAVRMRRDFHQHPELSGEEVWTSARICEELDAMGIPYDRVAPLNVVARLEGKPTGHTLAIRADFDALPIQEAVESPYRSRTDGKMHACGHDAHTAILLATARALAPHREELGGTVYFCFQMGEERGLGAQEIVDYLQERGGVEHAIGLHVEPAFRAGEMGLYDREACAGAFSWELVIHGKGGHGSAPHRTVDPIKPLCEILPRFSALPVNRTDPFSPLVVTPCCIQAGNSTNIIADTARAMGTARFYLPEIGAEAQQLMRDIAADVAHSYGAEAELLVPGGMLPPVLNDPDTAAIGQKAALASGIRLVKHQPMMASDNFACFLNTYPGFYAFLGVGNPERGITAPHHNPAFDLDEEALHYGVEFFLNCTDLLLSEGGDRT